MVLIQINEQIQEKRLVNYLKKKLSIGHDVLQLDKLLDNQEDYKKIFNEITKNNNQTYNQAFIRYVIRKDRAFFEKFSNLESLKSFLDMIDKKVEEAGTSILKAELIDKAYMNRIIKEKDYILMMKNLVSKIKSPDELDDVIHKFEHRKVLVDVLKPQSLLDRCFKAILGDS